MDAEMTEQPNAATSGKKYKNRGLYEVPLDSLVADPDQPRKHFDDQAIMDLGQSIKKHGILQPVLFREGEGGQLIVVAGERRFRACKAAGRDTIPGIYIDSGNSAEIALVENLLREDLNPVEEAEALQKLKDKQEYTLEQLAEFIGKAKSTISEIISLNKLPEGVKKQCREDSSVPRRVLVEIAKAPTHEEMERMFEKYRNIKLTRDETRREARKKPSPSKVFGKKVKSFCKILEEVDLEEFGEERADMEATLRELQEQIGKKLPAAE